MEGMWRPERYSWIYPFAVFYANTLTLPNSVALYGEFPHQAR